MQEFLSFFETLPILYKALWIGGLITFFWIFEKLFSFYKKPYKKWKHATTNFLLLVLVLIVNSVFGLLLISVYQFTAQHQFGLLYLIDIPTWAKLILSILVLDFISQYFVHFLLHKVKWMWRLHITHHTDKHVDVTTGTRHHPLDFMIRETFALLTVILMGMPISFYLFYRMLTVPFTYFNHADIKLPLWFDKMLSYAIVSPNMHKFHHHYQLPWTDSNYGNVLSVWDRIFGTFVYENPEDIQYGLDSADHTDDEDFLFQLKAPFKTKQIKSLD